MIVVLDACVLYPASLRDILLTMAALDAFEPRWNSEILEEVRRNVVADHPDIDPDKFTAHTLGAMRRAFPDALGEPERVTVERMDNHPKDRHVAALAVDLGADRLMTLNLRDFRSTVLSDVGVVVESPGDLVAGLFDDFPEVVEMAVQRLASRWVDPPRTPEEVTQDLARHPTMAAPMAKLRARIRQ